MRTPLALALSLVLAAPGLAVDCRATPGNALAANCSFDQEPTGWSTAPDMTIARVSVPDAGGALQAVADAMGSLVLFAPCVRAEPSASYRFSSRLRLQDGVAYFCSINAFQFSDEQCAGDPEPLGSAGLPPGAEWQVAASSGSTSTRTHSLQLQPSCSGEPGFVVQLDDFVLAKG